MIYLYIQIEKNLIILNVVSGMPGVMAVVMDSGHNLDDTTAEYYVVSNKHLKYHISSKRFQEMMFLK